MSKTSKTSERILLSEVASAQAFLMEVDSKTRTMIERAKKDPDIPIYLNGPIQRGDAPNKNFRSYPMQYLWAECLRYMEEEIANGQSFGELDHPVDSSTPRLTYASHTLEDIWRNPKDRTDKTIYGRIMLLNPYTGPGDPAYKARSIVLNNKTLGISSRALGSLEEGEEYDTVLEDLQMICWDLVSNPSTHKANLTVSESRQYVTESQCVGKSCGCKPHSSLISRENKLTRLEEIALQSLGVNDFLRIYKKRG